MLRISIARWSVCAIALLGSASISLASMTFFSGEITLSVAVSHPTGGSSNGNPAPVIYGGDLGPHSNHAHAQTSNANTIADVLLSSVRASEDLLVTAQAQMTGTTNSSAFADGHVKELIFLSEPTTLSIDIVGTTHSSLTLFFRDPTETTTFFATATSAVHTFPAGQYRVGATYVENGLTTGTETASAHITPAPEPSSAAIVLAIAGVVIRRGNRR